MGSVDPEFFDGIVIKKRLQRPEARDGIKNEAPGSLR
jgi:hypothetical protein